MLPVALIAGAALGAGQMIYGNHLKKKAAQAAAANVMPTYELPKEEREMLSQAETQAGTGMSAAAREALRQDSDRALGTNIDAINRGGGNINAIAATAQGTQLGLNKMALYEDSARLEHLKQLQEGRARMSANRDKEYQLNKYAPWANKAQAIAEQQKAAQNTFNSGVNTLGMGLLQSISNMPQGSGMPKFGYIPQQPTAEALPMTGQGGMEMFTPQPTSIPGYTPAGSPFGMMNENIDNTPTWNGYTWQ